MNTAVVNIKVEPTIKKRAQKIAHELGLSLSSLLNAYLREVVRTKRVSFDLREEPSDYFIKAMKEAREDVEKGRVSPSFANAEDAIAWLHGKKKTYARKI